jgi:transcriptional regulator with XRE-family HTH domain
MSATYLGFIERGENVPPPTTIFKLARSLKISPAALIDDAVRAS